MQTWVFSSASRYFRSPLRMSSKKINSFGVSLHAVSMVVTGSSFLLLRLAIHRNLQRVGNLERTDTAERRKHLGSLALCVVSLPLAYFHPQLALIVIALVTVVWVVPDLAIPKSPDP